MSERYLGQTNLERCASSRPYILNVIIYSIFTALFFFSILALAKSDAYAGEELIPYKILNREKLHAIKLSIDVEVPLIDDRLPNENELGELSAYLVSQEDKYERYFVTFLLPGMTAGAGAFATAHHNPAMEVRVMPFMLMSYPEYERFVK